MSNTVITLHPPLENQEAYALVDFGTSENNSIRVSKAISMENLIKFIKSREMTSKTIYDEDTGIVPENLLRYASSNKVLKYLYLLNNVQSVYKYNSLHYNLKYEINSRLIEQVLDIERLHSRVVEPYPICIPKLVVFVNYYVESQDLSYAFGFPYNSNSILGNQRGDITKDTLFYAQIFPNTFSETICWGDASSRFTAEFRQAATEKNHTVLSSIPYRFFSQPANFDLLRRNNELSDVKLYSLAQKNKYPKMFKSMIEDLHLFVSEQIKEESIEHFEEKVINLFDRVSLADCVYFFYLYSLPMLFKPGQDIEVIEEFVEFVANSANSVSRNNLNGKKLEDL